MHQAAPANGPAHTPYAEDWINQLYNLLFCDRPQDLATGPGAKPAEWAALQGPRPDLQAAEAMAVDRTLDSRLRLLACHVLRTHGVAVPVRALLGVVVEVPLDGGLDTLAAYSDGSVRYINHSGRVEIVEAVNALMPLVKRLIETSVPVVAAIGPWDKARLPAPVPGNVRLSFLVSDGLYFGEGPFPVMARDSMAGPIIDAATTLMQAVVDLSLRRAA